LGITPRGYAVCTLHRPSNVDDPRLLGGLLAAVAHVSTRLPVIFPVHPRTRKMIAEQGLGHWFERHPNLRPVDPMGHMEFVALTSQARLILTDSGGLQEETTALGVPCLTLRDTPERPVTVDEGTNTVVGDDTMRIAAAVAEIFDGGGKRGRVPALWDGATGPRVAAAIRGRWDVE
jgi:UDP-N-acetylglucosamine 2-epimerase (non-hydrolysing)